VEECSYEIELMRETRLIDLKRRRAMILINKHDDKEKI
jgi:hypothetical protein